MTPWSVRRPATLARMPSPLPRWLRDALAEPGEALWWAGDEDAPDVAPRDGLRAFTWRLDVADALRSRGIPTEFAAPPPTGSADRFVVRMAKEKALARGALDAAADALAPGGELVLLGAKDEGVVSLAKAASRAWGAAEVERDGPWRRFSWRRPAERPDVGAESLLPTPTYDAFGVSVHAAPGVFSWKRLDPGTERLLAWAEGALAPGGAWLDLGCGSGLLAAWLADHGAARVVATDSSALALRAAEATLAGRGAVVASDAGDGIEERFDGVLCNPPFHQGFDHARALTGRFVRGARRVLRPGGRAIFVVNAFVPLEREASGVFGSAQAVSDDGRYRVVEART